MSAVPVDPLPRRLGDINAAAQSLSLSPRTVWRLAKEGQLRSIRIGKSVRFALADIDRFIESRLEGEPLKAA